MSLRVQGLYRRQQVVNKKKKKRKKKHAILSASDLYLLAVASTKALNVVFLFECRC